MLSRTLMMVILTGIALDEWALCNNVTTRVSLQLEQTETRALRTSSEMKELASNVFFRSLEKIESSSVSKFFLTLFERSWRVITAFLLRLDRKLSTSLITSGVRILRTGLFSSSEWFSMILLNFVKDSEQVCHSYDLISTIINLSSFSGSLNGDKAGPLEKAEYCVLL